MVDCGRVVFSYLKSRLFYYENEQNLEHGSNRFGKRLYEIFFKTYTERCGVCPAQRLCGVAAQRVQGLSLTTAVRNALYPPKKTNIDSYQQVSLSEARASQMWRA